MHSCICIDTFKIKHNFYHKILIISQIIFLKVNIISHILKFLPKFNTTDDHFFFLIFNKIERVVIFIYLFFKKHAAIFIEYMKLFFIFFINFIVH